MMKKLKLLCLAPLMLVLAACFPSWGEEPEAATETCVAVEPEAAQLIANESCDLPETGVATTVTVAEVDVQFYPRLISEEEGLRTLTIKMAESLPIALELCNQGLREFAADENFIVGVKDSYDILLVTTNYDNNCEFYGEFAYLNEISISELERVSKIDDEPNWGGIIIALGGGGIFLAGFATTIWLIRSRSQSAL